jgi:hypothetical protein
MVYMLEAKGNKTTENLGNAKAHVPHGKTRSLLASRVVLAAD